MKKIINEMFMGALKNSGMNLGIEKAIHMSRIVHMLRNDMKRP